MNFLKSLCLIFLFGASSLNLSAQPKAKNITLKKGQILDILMLNNHPEGATVQKEYFKVVFPYATQNGYQPLPGLAIIETPTQGNYYPEVMVFATWKNLANRKKAMEEIEANVPDFHERRRTIWSSFNMTYYKVKEDKTLNIAPDKFYVTTAYWRKDAKAFKKFKKDWEKTAVQFGGQVKLALTGGTSPFGYYYNPDYLVLTEWKNKAAFDAFYKENLMLDHDSIKHVNQFIVK